MEIAQLTELRYGVALAYWAAVALYVVALRSHSSRAASAATVVMIGAAAAHLAEYVGRGALYGSVGGAPFTGISGFLSLAALLLGVGYLVLERRFTEKALGAFAVPVVAALHTVSVVLFRAPEAVPAHLQGPYLVVHIALVTAACVGLSAAFVSGVTYLALDAMLRWKRAGPLFRKLPNLDLLSRVHRISLLVGAGLLGLGAIAGALWAKSVWGFYFSWEQPKLVITVIAFVAAIGSGLAWRFPQWRGRRAAWLAVATIALTFAALALSSTFVDELHRFV